MCIDILSDLLTNAFVAVCTIRVQNVFITDPGLKMQAFRSF